MISRCWDNKNSNLDTWWLPRNSNLNMRLNHGQQWLPSWTMNWLNDRSRERSSTINSSTSSFNGVWIMVRWRLPSYVNWFDELTTFSLWSVNHGRWSLPSYFNWFDELTASLYGVSIMVDGAYRVMLIDPIKWWSVMVTKTMLMDCD